MKRYIRNSDEFDFEIFHPATAELIGYMKSDVPEDIKQQAAEIWKEYIDAEEYEEDPGYEELVDLTDAIDSERSQDIVWYALGILDADEFEERRAEW